MSDEQERFEPGTIGEMHFNAIMAIVADLEAGVPPKVMARHVYSILEAYGSERSKPRDEAADLLKRKHVEPPTGRLKEGIEVGWMESANGWVAEIWRGPESAIAASPAEAVIALQDLLAQDADG